MPRYYFDLHDDLDSDDPEGKVLADHGAAIDQAISEARHIICASVLPGHIDLNHNVDVRDDNHVVLGTVKSEDAIRVMRDGQPV